MDDDRPDIEVGALRNGCLTGCGAGCVTTALIFGLFAVTGLDLAHVTPDVVPGWIKFVGFLMGIGTYLLVGYVTALSAPHAPRFHAVIMGIVFMLLGVLGFVLPSHTGRPQDGDALLWGIVSWLVTIPMMLLGARWAMSRYDEND